MKLPDCSSLDEPLALLTAEEKRELMLKMAQGGDVLRDWVREKARTDPKWENLLERFRDDVQDEVRQYRRKVEESLEDDEEKIKERRREREAEVRERIEQAQARLAETRSKRADVLDEALSEADLARKAKQADEPDSAWQRFVAWLLDLWLRFKRWWYGLFGEDTTRTVMLAGPGGAGVELDIGFALAQSPEFRQEIKERLRDQPIRDRMRQLRDRLLGRRDYEEIVRDLVSDEVEQVKDEKEEQIEAQEEQVEEQVDDLEDEAEAVEQQADEALAEIERRRREAEEEIRRRVEEEPIEQLAGEVRSELARTGLVDEEGPTRRLLDRLGALLFEAEVRGLKGRVPTALSRPQGAETALEKHPMVTLAERSRVDYVESTVNAHIRHPTNPHLTEQDLIVYRNTEEPRAHVVLICDTSASMEEHGRMEAAKRATLALHGAVQDHSRDHVVDVVLMGTEVRRAGLQEVWNADPAGFTNTGGAITLARKLLLNDPADVHMVFLVTDGLPEAIMEGGEAVAAHPGEAQAYAIKQAERLHKQVTDLEFTCVLLEPDDELFVESANDLADELSGHVVATDPDDLAGHLLVEFGSGIAEKGEPRVV